MNWKKTIAIVAGLIIIVAFVLKLRSNKETATDRVYHFDKEQAINVQTQPLVKETVNHNLSYTGAFEANKETKISAETQGKVNRILVEEGDWVRKGQKLIQLDHALLLQQLNVLEVQSQNAEVEYSVQLNANQIQIDGLQKDVDRYLILTKADAIQGIQLEKAEMQLLSAENQRTAILNQGGLKTVKAQLESIKEQINKTTIRAPFNGIVTMKFTEMGSFAAPGIPLLEITDLASLKFTINVSEAKLSQFQLDNSYNIVADVYPDQEIEGKATLIGSKANKAGSFPIQFTLQNLPDYKIKSGMFGKISLQSENSEKAFLIPSSAIVGGTEKSQVYLVKDGKAKLQTIITTQKIGNKSVVAAGIEDGDILITNGLINLFDGANVTFN